MFDTFILSLFAHGYKVKPSTLFHLLKGKRSSSVLVYGFFYQSLQYVGLFPKLSEEKYNQLLKDFFQKRYLAHFGEEVKITELGLKQVEHFPKGLTSHIDNYHFARGEEKIWRLFLFSIQVVSEFTHQERKYLPIENTPFYTTLVKRWFATMNKENFSEKFKEELIFLLDRVEIETANELALQFTGHARNGLIYQQMDKEELFLQTLKHKNQLHELFKIMVENVAHIPLLWALLGNVFKQNHNLSMNQTKNLLINGNSLAEVSEKRGIKPSTVADHLLELALVEENFDFQLKLPTEVQNFFAITTNEETIISLRYSELNQKYPLEFVEFRLAQIAWIRRQRHGR
ncbi:MAG: helix-turn-helix domain-containing protein [Lactobacillales bacterium]|jgi:uncharacterized protein YpbB|nr:helix-turn-helix domain-containing protein [Lactobacillales bacterium]